MATDESGRWVPVGNENATRFNLLGAVIRAAGARARDAMKVADVALRTCSSDVFASTLTSSRPMTYAEAVVWLETAVAALAAQIGSELPAPSRTHSSGFMLKVSEVDSAAKQTTGTGGDDDS